MKTFFYKLANDPNQVYPITVYPVDGGDEPRTPEIYGLDVDGEKVSLKEATTFDDSTSTYTIDTTRVPAAVVGYELG